MHISEGTVSDVVALFLAKKNDLVGHGVSRDIFFSENGTLDVI